MDLLGPKFPGLAQEREKLFVKATQADFGEDLIERDGETWRVFEPKRSKLAAAIVKQASQTGIHEGDTILYLGASHGYTPSFISDMIGEKGTLFCVDFSANVVRNLLKVCKRRPNMIPVIGDARRLETFSYRVSGADVVYMDVAQRDQVGIFIKNCERFLKDGGFGILALKARSVDSARHPKDVFKDAYKQIEQTMKVVDYRELDPYERDHALFVVKK